MENVLQIFQDSKTREALTLEIIKILPKMYELTQDSSILTSVEYVIAKFECHSETIVNKLKELNLKPVPVIKHRPPLSVRTRMLSNKNIIMRNKSKENQDPMFIDH